MLNEARKIATDIRTGALPKRDVIPFILWLIGRTFWFWIMLIVVGLLLIVS